MLGSNSAKMYKSTSSFTFILFDKIQVRQEEGICKSSRETREGQIRSFIPKRDQVLVLFPGLEILVLTFPI